MEGFGKTIKSKNVGHQVLYKLGPLGQERTMRKSPDTQRQQRKKHYAIVLITITIVNGSRLCVRFDTALSVYYNEVDYQTRFSQRFKHFKLDIKYSDIG